MGVNLARDRGERMKLLAVMASAALVFVLASAVLSTEAVEPLGLTNAFVGGGRLNQYTPGVEGGVGLNNIGLLIRVWGEVTFRDTAEDKKFFCVDDGSGRTDGSGHTGIRVSYGNLAPGNLIDHVPELHEFVRVTGISSTFKDTDDKIYPNVRPRRQGDIIQP